MCGCPRGMSAVNDATALFTNLLQPLDGIHIFHLNAFWLDQGSLVNERRDCKTLLRRKTEKCGTASVKYFHSLSEAVGAVLPFM